MKDLKLKEYEVHNAFFTDANGLTVGSPVNFMGVRVGYVKKINIICLKHLVNCLIFHYLKELN